MYIVLPRDGYIQNMAVPTQGPPYFVSVVFLFNIEYLAEAGHVEYALYQWLKVAYDKFASFLGKVLVQPEEYA